MVQKLAEAPMSSNMVRFSLFPSHEHHLISSQLPDDIRALTVLQLKTLSGVAKGLTRSSVLSDGLTLGFDEDAGVQQELLEIKLARQDIKMVNLRQNILNVIRSCVELCGNDASVGQVRLFTLLPSSSR
jgi:hypothetical protein